MPDPSNIALVQTSACASPSSASILMDEVKYCKTEIAAPTGTTPFMQTIPPMPETVIVAGTTPKMLPAAAPSEIRPDEPAVNDTYSPGTTISTLSPTPTEMWILSEGHHTDSIIPATLPPPHRAPLTEGNLSLSLLGRLSTSEKDLDQSSGTLMMMQTTSKMSSFVGLTAYLTPVDIQAIILLSWTSNFDEATFHDTMKSHFGCINEEAHLLASLAAAGQQAT